MTFWQWLSELSNNNKVANIVIKCLVVAVPLLLCIIIVGHLVAWFKGNNSRLWLHEVNKLQPCTDTLYVRDTLWKHDTIRISVPVASNKPQYKTEGPYSPIIPAERVKNLATGQGGRAGDDNYFPSETLTEEQELDILNKVSNFRKINNLDKCISLAHSTEASGRIKYKVKALLEKNGYSVDMDGVTAGAKNPFDLETNGKCIQLTVGVFE